MKEENVLNFHRLREAYKARRAQRGHGWEQIFAGHYLFDNVFKCRDCGKQIEGTTVSPKYCPNCGKEHR